MSKYLGKFMTEAQYTEGLSSLDFPNVSLVEQTGKVHYSVAIGPKKIWDAAFGDILFYDVDGDTLINLPDEEYNTTDFPKNKFEPIGVCIYDKASYEGNNAVFMSLKWMKVLSPVSGSTTGDLMCMFGFNNVDLSSSIPGINSTSYIDTKFLNNELKKLVTVDWSGKNINTNSNNGSSPASECCWRFCTNGTESGNWYLPTQYDLTKYKNNYSTINTIITNIKTKAGSSIVSDIT